VIGPLIRAPHRAPRATPLVPGRPRRAKNALENLLVRLAAPFARWERQRLTIERVEVNLAGLPPAFTGYRVAWLTDLHYSRIVPRWWLDRAVAEANALAPDLIALGGDFVDDDADYVPGLTEILRPLAAPDGVVAVLGNHDHYVDAAGVRAAIRAAGVRELFNEAQVLVRGGASLAFAGLGDLERDVIDFARALGDVAPEVPRIVLSHDPDVFAYWPEGLRLDLMLAGHTHGGQAYLPLLGPPFVPSQFGFRYLKGLYAEGGRRLYVSRGVGAGGLPIRWRCPPELTLVTLHRA
jgi:predicted MPP superfamily phosphohydrolase